MKRSIAHSLCRAAFALMTAIAGMTAVHAQEYVNTPVEISKEKIRIDGKVCYSHVVLERQTLYSICKTYGVSAEEIYRYNPTLKETGLKKNTILIIPMNEEKVQQAARQERQAKLDSLTGISSEVPQENKQSGEPRIHVRKWYESLEDIAAQYGVSVEAIISANSLEGKKLKKRHRLIIPEAGYTPHSEEPTATPDTTGTDIMTPAEDTVIAVQPVFVPKETVKISLLLPLKASQEKTSRNNMDFYSGVLTAVRDLAEQGTGVELHVHDIASGEMTLTKEELETADMIIGPVSPANLSGLMAEVPQIKEIISPLDPKAESLVAAHPNLIQAPTPQREQYMDLARWVEEDFMPGDTILIISEKGSRQHEMMPSMKESLDSASLKYNLFSYSILEGRDVMEPLTGLMSKTAVNRVMIASESEAFVNDVVRNLNLLIYNGLKVVLYAPSKIRSYETIEVDNLHNLSLHLSLTYFIDYESDAVKRFLMRYRALFNTEPNQFAYQGYDVTMYFAGLCARYSDAWPLMLDQSGKKMLQSTFLCRKDGEGGYVNTGVRRVIYGPGYTVTPVR